MILKKLLSKRAQISMEMGILVTAVVAVATIAAYYYILSVKNSAENISNSANTVTGNLSSAASNFANAIPTGP